MDLLYLAITVLFFALAAAYAAGCNRLAPVPKAPGQAGGGHS